jgi:hypothetical protein
MTLPVPVDEETAIARATEWLGMVREKMTAQASREWLESGLRDLLLRDLIDRMEVVDAADAGDEIADAALGYIFHSMMDRGETPPACMIAYEARARRRGPLKRKAGNHTWDEDWRRNIGIACLVHAVSVRLGLNLTRNRESRRARRPSACSVVAEALRRSDVANISESRVQVIWTGLAGSLYVYVLAHRTFSSILQN